MRKKRKQKMLEEYRRQKDLEERRAQICREQWFYENRKWLNPSGRMLDLSGLVAHAKLENIEERIGNYEEALVEISKLESELWKMQINFLEEKDFFDVLPPYLQDVYCIGYLNGYMIANKSIETDAACRTRLEHCDDDKFQTVYDKGFREGRHMWHWMWNGM